MNLCRAFREVRGVGNAVAIGKCRGLDEREFVNNLFLYTMMANIDTTPMYTTQNYL